MTWEQKPFFFETTITPRTLPRVVTPGASHVAGADGAEPFVPRPYDHRTSPVTAS